MVKKLLSIIIGVLVSFSVFATTWKFEGGLDGEAGLMIVYKTLPPLIVEVEEPELMVVPRGTQSFRYSDVVRSKKPLNVKIEVYFNNEIVQDNGVNKEIVRTIYDRARLSFLNNGEFELVKTDSGILPRDKNSIVQSEKIDGEAIFTNVNGVIEALSRGKILTKDIGDTIKNGVLSRSDIYIDAIFNKNGKDMLSGQYEGSVTLEVEFLGKGVR